MELVVQVTMTLGVAMLVATAAGEALKKCAPRLLAFARSQTPWLAGQIAGAVMVASIATIDVWQGQVFVGVYGAGWLSLSTWARSATRRRTARPSRA